MGNNITCTVVGIGTMRIKMYDGVVRTLSDVRHVPDLKKNLLSLGIFDSQGYKYTGEGGVLTIYKGAMVFIKGKMVNGLYTLQESTIVGSTAIYSSSNLDSDNTYLWHMSEAGMSILSKRGLLNGQKIGKLDFCEHCVFGKQCRVKFSVANHRTKGTVDYIHSNLWGPSLVYSKGGYRYLLTFIDDYLRKVWVYFLKNKSAIFVTFKQWKMLIEKHTGKKIKRFRTDNGLEYCSGEFDEFCKNEGIVKHCTVRGTPQQNRTAERMNRTLLERARCMLSNCGLSKDFWAEAINMACYIVYRTPSTAIECKTPFEVWSDAPVDYSNLRVFGCPAYAQVNDGKLEPRAKKCIFLGYASRTKGYKLWCRDSKSPRLIVSKDVKFDKFAILD